MRGNLVIGTTFAALAFAALASSAAPQGGSVVRATVDSAGAQANGHNIFPELTPDGRFLAFTSYASNLAPGDANAVQDVYVHDLISGWTVCASVDPAGVAGNGESRESTISADGRYVAFRSAATDLVAGDGNGFPDVFVRDLQIGVTTLISRSTAGLQGDLSSFRPSISADGRFVAFYGDATNLVAGDVNGMPDVFLHDVQTGVTTLISRTPSGAPGNGPSINCAISADGRFVAFDSAASDLVANDTNGMRDVFVHEVATGQTTLVSVSSAGVQGTAHSIVPALSADGAKVVFQSFAGNLVSGDANGVGDVFVHDRTTGRTQLASVTPAGTAGNAASVWAAVSDDGRYVGFGSDATDIVPGDVNGMRDVFLRDMANGATWLVSANATGAQGNLDSSSPAPSADGRYVALWSNASNFVPGDTNDWGDLFVVDRYGCTPTIGTYCVAGVTRAGCAPAISAQGQPSASAGSGFDLVASAVEGNRRGLFLYGLSGPQAMPWGSGYLCVQAPYQRTLALPTGGSAGACDGQISLDWNAFIAANPSALGNPFVGGETVWAQAWFRNSPTALTNLSDAIWFTVCR